MTDGPAKPKRLPRASREARNEVGQPRESMLALLERLLSETVTMKLDGVATVVTKFDAIVLYTIQKGMSHDPRALSALAEYEELGRGRSASPSPRFVDSPYTRAMAKSPREGG